MAVTIISAKRGMYMQKFNYFLSSLKTLCELNTCNINTSLIKQKINDHGFKVIYYSHLSNKEKIYKLLTTLNLLEYSASVPAFVYCGEEVKIVFIRENLSEQNELRLLCHELGHIIGNQAGLIPLNDSTIEDEFFANEFAHYMLHPNILTKLIVNCKKHKTKVLLLVSILFLLVLFYPFYEKIYHNTPDTSLFSNTTVTENKKENFFVTPSGKKYHTKNCIHIKNKSNIIDINQYDAEKYGYAPCRDCLNKER